MVTKLTIEYDGAQFAGWASQPRLRTVQGELERALHTIIGERDVHGEPLRLAVAGRTDRGVHAWGQVASYRHEALDPASLNALLAEDVAVRSCEPAPEQFDARRDASSRTYCYRVLVRSTRSVFEHGRALWWPRPLDRETLHACAALLVGHHDFTAFTPTETDHVRFERDVLRSEWLSAEESSRVPDHGSEVLDHRSGLPDGGSETLAKESEVLEFWVEADTFMRHMNRVLVGTMLEVACGSRTIESFAELLDGRPRSQAGPTAPAHGLALASVRYRAA
jgi:tRNA pseudouridine38-40 synthase